MDENWQSRLSAAIAERRGQLAAFGVRFGNRVASSEGLKVEAVGRGGRKVLDPGPGVHLWATVGLWRIADPTAVRFELDLENLLTLQGPICFKCEEQYSADLAGVQCFGSLEWNS